MTLSLCCLLLLYFELRVVVVSSAGDILLAYFWTRPTKGHWTISQIIKSKGVLWQSERPCDSPQLLPPPHLKRFIKHREYLVCTSHWFACGTDGRTPQEETTTWHQTFFQQIRSLLTTFLIEINGYVSENLHQKACIIRTALHRGKRVQDSGQCPIFSSSHCFWEDLPNASFRLKTGRFQGTSRKQSVWEKGNVFISSLHSPCVRLVYA